MADLAVQVAYANNIAVAVQDGNNISVAVQDGNNIAVTVTPQPTTTITLDRGVAGVGVVSITQVDIGDYAYLDIVYSNGVTDQIGPIGISSAIVITVYDNIATITAVGNDLVAIDAVYNNLAAINTTATNINAIIAAPAYAAAAASSAADALVSEGNALASATSASTSASNASTSETNAAISASTATTKAAEASVSASNAATAETSAIASASNASTSEINAGISEFNSAASASTATSEASIATTQAGISTTEAGNAATSASNASISEINAAISETNAATSEASASNFATISTSQATIATTKAAEASTSAGNALSSEINAASSATSASTSESNAANSASNASTSETNSATSASNAYASEVNTEALYDSFDDRYLGAKSSDPALDNDGNALIVGALYWNTTIDLMKAYTGSAWVLAYAPSGSYVLSVASATNNALVRFDGVSGDTIKNSTVLLTDTGDLSATSLSLTNALLITSGGTGATTDSGARTNLGLGTSSVLDAGVALGTATLDAGGTVPLAQIPTSLIGGVSYQGTWNASTNTPTLTSSVGTKGYYFVVDVAGSTNLDGITDWLIGDWAIFNGATWEQIDNTDSVTSVNSYTGTVVLGVSDIVGAANAPTNTNITNITNITGGISSPTFLQMGNGSTETIVAGKQWYNPTLGSWNLGMGGGNITQQVGEELYRYGKASAAINDSVLQLIYKTGVVGASGDITFAPAVAGISDYDQIIGVATEPITLNSFGRVTTYGVIHNITTNGTAYGETWADNDDLYYNPVTGGLTKVLPIAPNMKMFIGTVINAGPGGSGSFIVKLGISESLNNLSNVQVTSASAGELLIYDATQGRWENAGITAGTGISITNADASITISSINNGTVTNVSATAPIASTGGATPNISIPAATASANGYLSAGDWSAFSNKQTSLLSNTANGVAYVNASNALTSGTALTFDGSTTLTLVTASATATVAKFRATNYGNLGTTYISLGTQYDDGTSRIGSLNPTGNQSALVFETHTSTTNVWQEGFRLTNTSLYTAIGIDVGIGTNLPGARLDLLSTYVSDTTVQARIRDNTGYALNFTGTASGFKSLQVQDSTGLALYTSLLLNPLGGNVGIGTSLPSQKLSIGGINANNNTNQNSIEFLDANGNNNFRITGGRGSTGNEGYGVFSTLTGGVMTERVRIESNGNVVLGSSANGGQVMTILQGYAPNAVNGSYGSLVFSANTNYTGGAGRYLLTNAFNATDFAIICSVDANTTPTLNGSGAVSSGTAAFVIKTNATAIFNSVVSVGAATPSTSGAGITFPATQLASSDANTLDDYEEGTWTTTFNSPANLTGTPTLSGATYTKIGRLVTITGSITGYSVTSSNTLTYPVFNLPFSTVGGNTSPLSGTCLAGVGSIWICGAFVDNTSGEATSVALVFPAVGVTTTGTASITFTLVYQTTT